MTVYKPAAAPMTVVTGGVHTASLDEAADQDEVFHAFSIFHPDVRLAHRARLPDTPPCRRSARVRWTVPGAARDDHEVRVARIPAALGALDAAAHIGMREDLGDGFVVVRGFVLTRSVASPAHDAAGHPPSTVALVTVDTDAMRYTDDGLWFTRLPAPPAYVEVGDNLAAHLALAFPTTHGDPPPGDILLQALSFYWSAMRDTLDRRCGPAGCPCGRACREHRPSADRIRHHPAFTAATEHRR
ncbi:hypothetical protein B4N89_45950 [Embleya scabrispora]|uniref:Uncharacterized protein n=1 Tax=Embleya scabrispora TaxID=159449 RepID=A0A1T3NJD7_9ACTN|nr:hypothetical protein [Embleya scabrispora]OPC76820.1 hypothetical protein B4N89_45950 [Embleya scabrispora]